MQTYFHYDYVSTVYGTNYKTNSANEFDLAQDSVCFMKSSFVIVSIWAQITPHCALLYESAITDS